MKISTLRSLGVGILSVGAIFFFAAALGFPDWVLWVLIAIGAISAIVMLVALIRSYFSS